MLLVGLWSVPYPKKYPHGYYRISSDLTEACIVSGS